MPDSDSLKNVLFTAYWFPPGGEHGVQRAAKFCKYLPDFGYRPLVLTGEEKDIRHKRDPSLLADVEGTKVFRCTGFERFLVQWPVKMRLNVLVWLLLRPDRYVLEWGPAAKRTAMKIAKEYPISAIVTTLMPMSNALLGLKLKRLLGVPWIVDYRDPWTTCTWRVWPTRLHFWWESRQERRVLEAADAAVVVTPQMKINLARRFPQFAHKIHVICNGFDSADFAGLPEPSHNHRLRIGYTGGFSDWDARPRGAGLGPLRKVVFYADRSSDLSTHSPLYLFRAVRALLDERPELREAVRITFAGKFSAKNAALVKELKLEDVVSVKGYLPHAESIQLLADSDVLFFALPTPLDGGRSHMHAGKLFEYLAAEKPILAAIPHGDAKDLIESARAGWCVEPRDVDGMKSLLEQLIEEKQKAQALTVHPNREYIAQYDRRALTGKLAALLDTLLC